MAEIFFGPSLY